MSASFLTTLNHVFQTDFKLYFVLDYITWGNILSLSSGRKFREGGAWHHNWLADWPSVLTLLYHWLGHFRRSSEEEIHSLRSAWLDCDLRSSWGRYLRRAGVTDLRLSVSSVVFRRWHQWKSVVDNYISLTPDTSKQKVTWVNYKWRSHCHLLFVATSLSEVRGLAVGSCRASAFCVFCVNLTVNSCSSKKKNSVALVRKRTIPYRPTAAVGEVSANFCG
jgi:hypothetical protein